MASSTMLKLSARWQCDASIEHQMAGNVMFKLSAQWWQHNALMERPMAGGAMLQLSTQ
jgi:hypothetical protein